MDNIVLSRKLEPIAGNVASFQNIVMLTVFDLLLVIAGAFVSWYNPTIFMPYIIPLCLLALGIGIFTGFYPKSANITGPTYAIMEGVVIGVLSLSLEMIYPKIVLDAVLCTFGIAIACAFLYGSGIITVSTKLKKTVFALTLGIACMYLIDLGMLYATGTNLPLLHDNSPKGILVSFIICIIATLRLLVDYDMVKEAVEKGVSAEYDAYYAFGLTVSLIWLYLEILRLFSKARSKK